MFARAMRELGHDALSVNYYWRGGTRVYTTDRNLKIKSGQRTLNDHLRQLRFGLWAMKNFEVFHFFFGESLFPRLVDLAILRKMRKRVFVHFHGRDITSKKLLIPAWEASLSDTLDAGKTPSPATASQLKMVSRWRKYADALFVSTPDLLHVVPDAILVPQPIELEKWQFNPEQCNADNSQIVIAHAPTDRELKGTSYVIEAVRKLQLEGLDIRLELIESVPPEQIMTRFRRCQICIDQLLQGSYGTVAVECMALGIPVIARLDSIHKSVCPDVPIVNADPHTLVEKLRLLVKDGCLRLRLAMEGRKFVERRHDAKVIAADLINRYTGRS